MKGKANRRIGLTSLFGSFVFLQFTVLGLANRAGEGYLSTGRRESVYYTLQLFVILGFFLYGVLYSRFARPDKSSRVLRGIGFGVLGIFLAGTAVLLFAGTDSLFYVIVSMVAVLCLGLIGGAVHHRMSMETVSGSTVAWSMGTGSAAAVILQYLLQIGWGVTPVLPVFMLAAFLLIFALLRISSDSGLEEDRKPEQTPPGRLLFSIIIVAAFLLFLCFYNEYIHHLQIQSDYENYTVYSWPRLMMVPCYLLFAVIGDRKKGNYVPIAALCIALAALLNAALTGSPGSYWLNMCLFYCALAASTSYYLLTFWRLAPGTKYPALWAPAGRMIDSGMVLFAGAIHLSTLSAPVVLGVNIAGVAVIIVLMTVSGSFNLSGTPVQDAVGRTEPSTVPDEAGRTEPSPVADAVRRTESSTVSVALNMQGTSAEQSDPDLSDTASMLSEEDALKRMQAQYALTPRETEVLAQLVLTEDKQAVISERMSIRVKTLQDYVTKLYRKTGAKTRAGLTELFRKTQMDG